MQLWLFSIRILCTTTKECESILRDESSVYFNVTALNIYQQSSGNSVQTPLVTTVYDYNRAVLNIYAYF